MIPHFSHLISAAERGDWDFVDANLEAVIAEDLSAVSWAETTGLRSSNENLRDLAASIFGKKKGPLPQLVLEKLFAMLREDPGIYVRFRVACALWVHGERWPHVKARLRSYINDRDEKVAALAREYLAQADSL